MARPCATCTILALLLGFPAVATAYDFEVSARTEGHGYQLRRYDRDGLVFLNRRRLAQYLGLRIFDLLDPGALGHRPGDPRRPPQLLYLNAQLRFSSDFGEYGRPLVDSPELRNDQLELLLAALEGRNLLGCVDFTLGRQFDAELMDFFGYDGLRVKVSTPWRAFVEAHFGIEVDRARPFSPAELETDGVSGDLTDEAAAPTFGVALGVEDLEHLDLRLAYRGIASRGDAPSATGALRPLWGIDQELLFLSAAYRVPRVGTALLFGTRYDLLLGGFDELQGALVQHLGERQRLELEALRSRPHFDGDSIFNLFAVEPYTELAGRYALRVAPTVTLEGRGGYRWFWRDASAEPDLARGALTAALFGRVLTSRVAADVELYYLQGPEGRRGGGDLDGRWRTSRFLTLEGRLSLVASEDAGRAVPQPLTTFGFELGARIHFVRGVMLQLLLEDNISRLYDSALRLYGVLDLELSI